MRILLNIVQLSLSSIRNTGVLRTAPLRPTISYRHKWTSRTPTAILNEEEIFDTDNTETTVTKPSKVRRRFTTRKEKHKKQEEKRIIKKEKDEHLKEEEEEEKSETAEADKTTAAGLTYTSLKGDEKFISSVMIDVRTKQRRGKCNLMLLEGLRLIQDAVLANVTPEVIFFSRFSDIQKLSLPKKVQVYKIPYHTIQLWSVLTTSPGIMGLFEIPDTANKEPSTDSIPLTIICDNIREPGNLGTIVRAAAAVGCEKLLLMKGCADLWDSKVLRSAMGAHFRIPILTSISWNEIPTIINEESAIFLADNRTTYKNEFEDEIVDESDMHFDESSKEDEINGINQVINKTKNSTTKIRSLVKQLTSQLPVESYHMLQFTQKEVVLVIGGETEGLSLESCKLLRARNCIRVHVPLTNDIDSLNVGVAVGIITFEIKRQFIIRKMKENLE